MRVLSQYCDITNLSEYMKTISHKILSCLLVLRTVTSTGTPKTSPFHPVSRHDRITDIAISIYPSELYIIIPKFTMFLKPLKWFLENPHVYKTVFDARGLTDCLSHVYDVNLRGGLDLQLLEFLRRGEVVTRVHLPTNAVQQHDGKITTVVRKEEMFSLEDCLQYYVGDVVPRDLSRDYITCFNSQCDWKKAYSTRDLFMLKEVIYDVPKHTEDVKIDYHIVELLEFYSNQITKIQALYERILPGNYFHEFFETWARSSARQSQIHATKSFRTGDRYDTHNHVYGHVISVGSCEVLSCVIECEICKVMQPIESFRSDTHFHRNNNPPLLYICNVCAHMGWEEKCAKKRRPRCLLGCVGK